MDVGLTACLINWTVLNPVQLAEMQKENYLQWDDVRFTKSEYFEGKINGYGHLNVL